MRLPVAALRALARADPARHPQKRQRCRHFLTAPRITPQYLRDDAVDLRDLQVIERILAVVVGGLSSILALAPSPARAQAADAAAALVSTAWCHESSTGISLQTTRLRFQPNGVLLLRKDTDLANGSHTGSNYSARWEVNPDLLIIHEPNGGESRLPMSFAGEGRNTRLTLSKMTYSVCR